ncbi:hypothetical protein BpHYR1_015504 [Brachionus plicatilis]|uniref:Uncharacterized protein n=1 Tax=Brachionus plicatilis TaxID=10195 RepID=A0A3M7SK72_BRAPC|nr:hypothetical protein BpHYR1_015504 [Brachionus plicatilis]
MYNQKLTYNPNLTYDTPSKELNNIAQLPSVEERRYDLNEAYAFSAICNRFIINNILNVLKF